MPELKVNSQRNLSLDVSLVATVPLRAGFGCEWRREGDFQPGRQAGLDLEPYTPAVSGRLQWTNTYPQF